MFRAQAKGRPLILDDDGIVAGNEVFKDRGTGSRWQQSSLQAIAGPLKGEHLQLYPFLLTSWEEWRHLHPNTLVLKPLPGYADRIAASNAIVNRGLSGEGNAPDSVTYKDERLKPKTMILGLEVDGASKAFPLESLRRVRVVNDTIGSTAVLVVHQLRSDTTTAFVARVRARALTFVPVNAEATELTDRETHSRWNAYGRCLGGRLKGSQLERLILEPEYWFAWSEFHRDTAIFIQE